LYRYCGNDWANRTDPMGLEAPAQGLQGPDITTKELSNLKRDDRGSLAEYAMLNVGRIQVRDWVKDAFGVEVGQAIREAVKQGNTYAQNGSGDPQKAPALPSGLPAMKSATDRSAEAMHKDPDKFPYTVANGTGGQSAPKRGIEHTANGHQYFREVVAIRGQLLSVGHVHNKGAAGFSDPDKALGVPIMKNRDGYIDSKTGQVQQYDLYYSGWRWYLRPDMTIQDGPMRY